MTKKTTTPKTPAADHIPDVGKMITTETQTLFVGQSTASSTHSGTAPAECVDDFVSDVLAIVGELVPGARADVLRRADAQIRERWGGDRPYIARRVGEGRSERNAAIRREFQRGDSLALLERRHGLCRRQLLRIVQQGV